jgi:hypothetical protein
MSLPRTAKITSEARPVQIEGNVAGFPFYFRARYNHWSITIVEPGENPVRPADVKKIVFDRVRSFGNYPFAASWMPIALARQIVRRNLDRSEYLVQQRLKHLPTKNGR